MMRVAWAMPICRFMSRERINDLDSEKDVAVGGERPWDRLRGSMPAGCSLDGFEARKGIMAVRLERRG